MNEKEKWEWNTFSGFNTNKRVIYRNKIFYIKIHERDWKIVEENKLLSFLKYLKEQENNLLYEIITELCKIKPELDKMKDMLIAEVI